MLLVGVAGCGEAGVAEDATVAVYAEAGLCSGAREELGRNGGKAGDLKVRVNCLPSPHKGKQLSLATLGANARQATQDSTAVAYLEAPDPKASRFTHPILESAEVPWIKDSSGTAAMAHLLKLIESSGSGSLRHQLNEQLHES